MKQSILDTDTLSMFLKGDEKVRIKIKEHVVEFGSVSLSVITYYEILNGLLFKDARKQMAVFEEFVSINTVIPLDLSAAVYAANIEADLRKKNNVIGHSDTLIAGTALSNGLQLVTNNTEHFKRVKGLELANWLK